MVHCRLSAVLAHHRRQPGSTPRRKASELVTPVSDEAARGPSGCIAVECERRSGGVLIGISTAFGTVDDERVLAVLCGLPRLCRRARRWWRSHLRGDCVGVSAREQYSRQQLASAGAAQCSVVRPQLLHRHVDGLLCRLDSTHFASAFMHADDRTLVALRADLRACGAEMPAAVSVVATWGAEHYPSIDADRSGAALFCIASNGNSDEDTADHRLGGGNPRVKSHLVRLLGNAIDRHLNFVSHVTVAAGQFVLLCCRPRLGAEAGASHHTMRSLRVGVSTVRCTTAARQSHRVGPTHPHGLEVLHGDSCTASLVPRVSKKDASVHLTASPAPLRRIVVFRAPTPHERLTRLRYIEDVCGAICSETML
ncbi:hypothetical protein TCDM_10122 [Trypanosoma cruzi Dm28c]|uniref:Uncharacterized protein n=1 Tax=Trypanosoma cruzi Dm28c TaxID=1416333 RepID=V5B3S4_TRYCR|nr:hypothetical protein TCDM_10122 [Trypanosoma cruzi Dm28c]